jgi:hypothetical protein
MGEKQKLEKYLEKKAVEIRYMQLGENSNIVNLGQI